jgi:hypothetical protein
MKDTLMFIMYADSTGKNVTVSPRLSSGNVEPVYTSNVTCTVGPDSGIANGTMTARVLCQNCRTWKGGLIDPTSTAEKFIFGSGPRRSLKSNFATAALQEHSSYGTFTMDLTKAVGEGQFPNVVSADTVGTVQDSIQSDHNFLPALHAALMIIAFLGLMPIGLLILRVVDNVRWHGLNQTLSAVVALIGAFVGIYLGTIYNRVGEVLGDRYSSLTCFIVARFPICSSNIRHRYHSYNGCPIYHWIHTPSNIQENVSYYQACANSRLAWPCCYRNGHGKRFPVSSILEIPCRAK